MQTITEESRIRFVKSEIAPREGFGWAMTTRDLAYDSEDGDAAVRSLAARACAALGVTDRHTVCGRQVHGAEIFVSESSRGRQGGFLRVPDTDGIISNSDGEVLGIVTADCSSVAVFARESRWFGIAHSGWRSTAANIVPKLARKLAELSGAAPERFSAVIGPTILGDCYEVGPEVVEALHKAGGGRIEVPGRLGAAGKFILDLPGYIARQLLSEGIVEENIEIPTLCTACRSDLFFSWRRSADTSRMITLLWRP